MDRPLSMLILTVAAFLMGGCSLPLPEHRRTPGGLEVRSLVGSADSNRPLRLGVTPRPKVIAVAGEPTWRTTHDRAMGYAYVVRADWFFDPLVVEQKAIFPFHHRYAPGYYFLFLEFDATEMLSRFQLLRKYGWYNGSADAEWRAFIDSVSDADAATTRPAPTFSGN